MRIAAETGIPVLRPMFFEFPDQEYSYFAEDQFMFGPDWLVAPVTVYNATQRSVFLPMLSSASEVWVHHYTQRAYRGPQIINMYSHPRHLFFSLVLIHLPLFSLADSRLWQHSRCLLE